MHETLKH